MALKNTAARLYSGTAKQLFSYTAAQAAQRLKGSKAQSGRRRFEPLRL